MNKFITLSLLCVLMACANESSTTTMKGDKGDVGASGQSVVGPQGSPGKNADNLTFIVTPATTDQCEYGGNVLTISNEANGLISSLLFCQSASKCDNKPKKDE